VGAAVGASVGGSVGVGFGLQPKKHRTHSATSRIKRILRIVLHTPYSISTIEYHTGLKKARIFPVENRCKIKFF
jgi:hypothetical protein